MNDQFRKVIGTMLEASYDCLTTDDLIPTVENLQLMNSSLDVLTHLTIREAPTEIVQLNNTPLLDNILEYGKHLHNCDALLEQDEYPCDCGWDEFKETLEQCR